MWTWFDDILWDIEDEIVYAKVLIPSFSQTANDFSLILRILFKGTRLRLMAEMAVMVL